MHRSTIIVAGGSGKRMGATVPKQFLLLKGRPLLCWTIEAFQHFDPAMPIVLVLPEDQIPIWKRALHQLPFRCPAPGGGRWRGTLPQCAERPGLCDA